MQNSQIQENPNQPARRPGSGDNGAPTLGKNSSYPFAFHGKGMDLAILILKNVILTILSLGIYSFWGKVEVRKFIWSNTEFFGSRFQYTGTGKELFMGFLKVMVGYFLFIGAYTVANMVSPKLGMLIGFILFLAFYCVLPAAIYMSRRYLMSRTIWRGLRFGMTPGAKGFVGLFIGNAILTMLTVGLYGPVMQNNIYRYMMERSHFGSAKIRYTGSNKDAFFLFLKYLLFIILTFGLAIFAYQAALIRWRTENTWLGNEQIGAAKGSMRISAMDYFSLILVNIVVITLTLGLAFPWVMAHNLSFFLDRLSFNGQIDFAKVLKSESSGNAVGDGLADVLDIGSI